ncbi:hypothetical protein COT72_04005 [archaeon CG10_big_fil_rev_8_21_14_0_10_43_11]|nr:MAG: hypothetical protein COT72_04005 [archaeon CG10_big_fil_rev_8_21_14_0_10_43_11]
MKILQVPSTFLPRKGGVPYYVYYLSKEMMKQGHDVSVLTSTLGSKKSFEVMDGIPIKRVKSLSILGMPFSLGIFFEILKSDADIVQLHYPHPIFLDIGALACIIARKTYVVYSHGKEIRMNWFFGLPSSLYNKFCYTFILKHAAGIIVNSRKAIKSSKFLSRYKKKINVIYHGVDTKKFVAKKRNLHSPLQVLFVGALRRYKGLDYLVDAAKLLENEKVSFTIVGNGPQEAMIKKKVLELGLERKIIFRNFLPEKELLKMYEECDVFVLPSPSIEESFGMVALEAGAMGKPVIVTYGAGVSELFLKEKLGVVIEPYSGKALGRAIMKFINNKRDITQVGYKLKGVIALKYSWKHVGLATINFYKGILK